MAHNYSSPSFKHTNGMVVTTYYYYYPLGPLPPHPITIYRIHGNGGAGASLHFLVIQCLSHSSYWPLQKLLLTSFPSQSCRFQSWFAFGSTCRGLASGSRLRWFGGWWTCWRSGGETGGSACWVPCRRSGKRSAWCTK